MTLALGMPAAPKRSMTHSDEMIQSLLSVEEAKSIRQLLGPFIERAFNPGAVPRDRAGTPIPREVFREAGRLGLMGFTLPTDEISILTAIAGG